MTDSRARVRFIEQAIVAQEEERARIARELHDGIGQSLTSLLVGLRSLEASLDDGAEAKALASQLRETAGRAIDEVRALAQGLRPTALDDLGLGPAIERLVEDLGARHRLAIDVQLEGLDTDPRLPASLEITVYRIVQEALHNVVKHARATRASVVIRRRSDDVRLVVEDDGKGMLPGEQEGGFGLQGIRERLALVRGELAIESSTEEGTSVFATIPCRPRSPRRFVLQHEDQETPLPPGEYLVGRSASCDIQLDRRRVSRLHAKLSIGEHEAYVEDLGSMNGVFVNGRRVEGSTRLSDRDVLLVGDEQLRVRGEFRTVEGEEPASWRSERTLPGHAPQSVREVQRAGESSQGGARARDVTERANMLEVAGTMALRWLEEGRTADAERLLTGHLRQVLDAARAGQAVPLPVAELSASYALRLALAAKSTGWMRYALELLERANVPPSVPAAAAVERLAREGVPVPQEPLAAYLRSLEGSVPSSGEAAVALSRLQRLYSGMRRRPVG